MGEWGKPTPHFPSLPRLRFVVPPRRHIPLLSAWGNLLDLNKHDKLGTSLCGQHEKRGTGSATTTMHDCAYMLYIQVPPNQTDEVIMLAQLALSAYRRVLGAHNHHWRGRRIL